uniref:ACT domain-containing protein n=1 Tax=Caenorhabditis tropicalis TaxID=1561998 RepID=A0A1I7TPG7_9PELO
MTDMTIEELRKYDGVKNELIVFDSLFPVMSSGRTEGIEDKGSLHTQPNLLLRFQTSFIKRNLPADPRCSAQSVRDVLGLLRTNRTIVKIEQVTNKCTTKKIDVIVFSNVEDEVSISVKKIKDIEDKTTIIF